MKTYVLIPFFLIFYCSVFSQQIDNSSAFTPKLEKLVQYHNQLINNQPFQDSLFYNLFTEQNLLIDNLYLMNDFINRTSLSLYLKDLKNGGQNQRIGYTINFVPIRISATTVWCKRTILNKDNFENIIYYKVFKFRFQKIGDDFKIAEIQQVADEDFDGIEDAIDDCKNEAGISNKKCNGCPDYDNNGKPNNCPKSRMTKGESLWLYSGITVTGVSAYLNIDTYLGWNKYLNQNNQKDVDKKYSAEKRNLNLSKIGVGVGAAILGTYLMSHVNKKTKRKRMLLKYDAANHFFRPDTKRKWYLNISNKDNSIGIALRF